MPDSPSAALGVIPSSRGGVNPVRTGECGRTRLVTTNPDPYCPFPGGRGEPDAAAVVAAIEACTGVRCEANVGKPDPLMLEAALLAIDVPREACLMIGDRMSTDITMAVRAGMDSALVLTGEATLADVEATHPDERPTYILETFEALRPISLDHSFVG